MADLSYRLVLQCLMPYETEIEGEIVTQYEDLSIEFDLVNDTDTSSTSDITNHPLVSGDMIADHMYRNPVTMSVSGAFSLQGNKPYAFKGDSNDRLTNIEVLFERIKNEGIHCTLVKLSSADNATTRFIARHNMVLTSIMWKERQNSLGFTLGFTEAITAEVQEVEYDVDVTDPNLPAITDAATLNFTDTLLDWGQVDQIVCKQLYDVELLTAEFLQYAVDAAKSAGVGAAVGLAVGVGVAITGLWVLAGIVGGLSAIPVAGWIAAAVVVVVAVIVGFFVGLFKSIKRSEAKKKYKTEQFKLYKDDEKNRKEVERFCNYLGRIHKNIETLNDVIQVYSIAENCNQECMTYIDDNYYIFKFEKNNTSGKWSLNVTCIDGTIMANQPELCGFENIGECQEDNALFRTIGGGFWVYVMNLKSGSTAYQGMSEEERKKIDNDLTSYAIMVSQINMTKFQDVLKDVVLDAMTR